MQDGSRAKYSGKEDVELLALVNAGDHQAFEIIYDRYWQKLFRAAARVVDDPVVAQDIVQEVLISLWEKGSHKDILNVSAYLFQCVKLQCFMHMRSGTLSRKHLAHINSIAAVNAIEESMDAAEMNTILEKSIASLPEKCREVFFLSRMERLSHKKIAEQLSISPKTVENQITKALKLIRLSVDRLVIITAFLLTEY